jgi:hypothetical protein
MLDKPKEIAIGTPTNIKAITIKNRNNIAMISLPYR